MRKLNLREHIIHAVAVSRDKTHGQNLRASSALDHHAGVQHERGYDH